jgi:Tfp pilus assembly protein PilZ
MPHPLFAKTGDRNMISTLQRSFKLKKEFMEPSFALKMNECEVVARLYYLINNLTEKQQIDLFKQFLNGSTAAFLLKMTIDMSKEQRFIFMRHLEEMQPARKKPDRRAHPRKDCLINVRFKIRGRKFSSYILDISSTGAFIETNEIFSTGLKMLLTFSSPQDRKPLDLIGEIIWADPRGIGVEFHHLTREQTRILKSFTEKSQEVLEIAS